MGLGNISIILPVYNGEKYLARCIDSILAQSYKEFELLIIDDGSTDQTKTICNEYARKDDRIQYVYQTNAGPEQARQAGIALSGYSYIMFVDSDDYVDSRLLGTLVEQQKETEADIVCSQLIRVDDTGRKWSDYELEEEHIDCATTEANMHHFFATRYISGSYVAKLIKKELFEGYCSDKQTIIGEDVAAIIYIIEHAKKIRIISGGYYYYYWNLSSISHSGYTSRHIISLQNYIALKERLLAKSYINRSEVCGYICEFEMAVATAMSRSNKYVKETADFLRSDIKNSWDDVKANKYTARYMKICMYMYIHMPRVFHRLYRIYYLATGR